MAQNMFVSQVVNRLHNPTAYPLLTALCDAGYQVSLETSGALDVSQVDRRVSKVVDLKTPDSGEAHRNLYENMQHLTATTKSNLSFVVVKIIQWAKFKMDEYQLNQRVSDVLLSPSHQQQDPRELAEWILADKLAVRLQIATP